MLAFTYCVFILANSKEEDIMVNVIEVKPDKEGRIFITLYGTKYEIVVKKPAKKKEENAE